MSHPLNGTVPAVKCADCGHFAPVGEITECRFCDCKRHAGSPYAGQDPQSPVGAENAIHAFTEALEAARVAFAEAVDEEADAILDREMARARLTLADDCPAVGVFDGVRVTVGQRDAWVLLHSEDEERTRKKAGAKRLAAEKFLEVVGRKLSAQQSIAKSVGQSYGASQGSGRW
ncbi:MAG TPA: hypothetical protein VMU94_07010 [Streptosporangiaceae bacterium]|nr:hypothetical protein [Streptosporangiaceae bacterium]